MTERRAKSRRHDDGLPLFGALAVKLIGWVARPLRGIGVDARALGCIVDAKLRLDARRTTRGQEPRRGRRAWANIVYVLFGFAGGMALQVVPNPIQGMGIALGVVMFFTVASLISDYSAVFLDDTDAAVLAPLPVSDRTMYAARLAHVVVYLGRIVALISIGPIVLGAFAYPPLVFVPVFVLAAALTAMLCVSLAFGAYLIAMRFVDLDKFKDALLYAQIAVMVTLIGGLQLAQHVVDLEVVAATLESHPWIYFALPPCHYGGMLAVTTGHASGLAWGLAASGIVLPFALLWTSLRMSRGFVAQLATLQTARGVPRRARANRARRQWRSRLARAGFDFTAALVRREKQFRMRTYPLVAVALVVGVALALRRGELNPATLCAVFYFAATYLPIIVLQSRYSENHEARWVLEVAPMAEPRDFIGGGLLALLLTFFVPMCLFLGLAVLAIGGWKLWPDMVFSAEVVLILALSVLMVMGRRMPFSEPVPKQPQHSGFSTLLLMGLVVGVVAGLHAVLRMHEPLFYTAIAMGLFAVPLLVRVLRRLPPQAWHVAPD